jgi:hypothetical protein
MSVTIESLGPATLEVTIDGNVEAQDYEVFVPQAEERIRRHGSLGLLLRVRNLRGETLPAMWEDLKFDVRHYRDLSRLALVAASDSKRWMATLSRPFTAADVRFFNESELETARDWVKEG